MIFISWVRKCFEVYMRECLETPIQPRSISKRSKDHLKSLSLLSKNFYERRADYDCTVIPQSNSVHDISSNVSRFSSSTWIEDNVSSSFHSSYLSNYMRSGFKKGLKLNSSATMDRSISTRAYLRPKKIAMNEENVKLTLCDLASKHEN